jgi:hypothetical protein
MNESLVPAMSFSRRQMLQQLSSGFGFLAFSSLATMALSRESSAKDLEKSDDAKSAHFPAKAQRVIFLCMRGGPSHVDTFDYKPELDKLDGKSGKFRGTLMKSPWTFNQQRSGLWISELLPEIGSVSQELCILRGMHTDLPVHTGAMTQLHTGTNQFVRPSLGSWTLYGLGSENESLPGFVVINPAPAAAQNYGSAFLPAVYQATSLGKSNRVANRLRGGGEENALSDIRNPRLSQSQQKQQLRFVQQLNREKLKKVEGASWDRGGDRIVRISISHAICLA